MAKRKTAAQLETQLNEAKDLLRQASCLKGSSEFDALMKRIQMIEKRWLNAERREQREGELS